MEEGKPRYSSEVRRPLRNFFKLVPLIEWFYPIDHRRLWKDAYNEAHPTGKALKESYQAVWEVNTIAAVLVLSMNALLFFGLLTGESKQLYWDATPAERELGMSWKSARESVLESVPGLLDVFIEESKEDGG